MTSGLTYPVRFEPIFKERLWGGRRIETVLGKPLPQGSLIGESWEIADHGNDVSRVTNGPLAGTTLRDLVRTGSAELFGPSGTAAGDGFPLLVKWIDAREKLSVQVHPPDGHPLLAPGERGKTECWFVVEAEPDATIYLGLRRGVDRAALQRELVRGTAEACLNVHPARAGDFFFVPAGVVHAIGGGVLLAEVQQSSDTTFRLYDWNRLDTATGQPRPLQIVEALDSIDFHAAPALPCPVRPGTLENHCVLLGEGQCPYFHVSWRRFEYAHEREAAGRCHVWICLDGHGCLHHDGQSMLFRRGDCLVLPAQARLVCEPAVTLQILDVRIP
jgi:mannose-6-phosphate isomerase